MLLRAKNEAAKDQPNEYKKCRQIYQLLLGYRSDARHSECNRRKKATGEQASVPDREPDRREVYLSADAIDSEKVRVRARLPDREPDLREVFLIGTGGSIVRHIVPSLFSYRPKIILIGVV